MKLSQKAGLLALGLGILAVYKYNKMSDDEKDALKAKGKKIYDDHISPLFKSALGLGDESDLVAEDTPAK